METRGAYGFIVNGKTKVTYNHYDSYPSELGVKVLTALTGALVATAVPLVAVASAIEMVNEDDKPTPAQVTACAPFIDVDVGSQSTDDWYCLLRGAQGDIDSLLAGNVPFMIDSAPFLLDSLFCEWAYIMNLDTQKLEVYKGFNQDRKAAGRYAKGVKGKSMKGNYVNNYVGVALIDEVPFADIAFGKVVAEAKAAEWEGSDDE